MAVSEILSSLPSLGARATTSDNGVASPDLQQIVGRRTHWYLLAPRNEGLGEMDGWNARWAEIRSRLHATSVNKNAKRGKARTGASHQKQVDAVMRDSTSCCQVASYYRGVIVHYRFLAMGGAWWQVHGEARVGVEFNNNCCGCGVVWFWERIMVRAVHVCRGMWLSLQGIGKSPAKQKNFFWPASTAFLVTCYCLCS